MPLLLKTSLSNWLYKKSPALQPGSSYLKFKTFTLFIARGYKPRAAGVGYSK